MKKKAFKRILGLLVLMLFLSVNNVYATTCNKEYVNNKYLLTLQEKDDNNNYSLSITLNSNKKNSSELNKYKNVKFKVTKIYPDTPTNRAIVASNHELKFNKISTNTVQFKAEVSKTTETGATETEGHKIDKYIKVYLEATGDPVCNGNKITLEATNYRGINKYPPSYVKDNFDTNKIIDKLKPNNPGKTEKESIQANYWETNFAEWNLWVSRAQAAGNVFVLPESKPGEPPSVLNSEEFKKKNRLYCNFKLTGEQIDKIQKDNIKVDKENDKYYYDEKNDTYYMATNVQSLSTKYRYYFEGRGENKNESANSKGGYTEETATCKRECTEVVEVKYGPPAAIRGGQCFQYQVKVTSYVSCKIKETPQPPKKYQLCQGIYPQCYHNGGYALGDAHSAGPKEDFERCINKCDKGKYTAKCSLKCYNQVYGKNKKLSLLTSASVSKLDVVYNKPEITRLSIASEEAQTNALLNRGWSCGGYYGENIKSFKGGYYTFAGGNTLTYHKVNPNDTSEYQRWFDETGYTERYNLYGRAKDGCHYIGGTDGNSRQIENGQVCQDTCTIFYAQSDKCYLNSTELDRAYDKENKTRRERDYEENYKAYQELSSKCSSLATCNTESTTYTIEAKINDNGKIIRTTKLDNNQDTLQKSGKGNEKVENLNYIIGYDGCYAKNAISGHYKTEWTLPLTWYNFKTGLAKYTKGKAAGYKAYPQEICVALNTPEVNASWWKCYVGYLQNLKNGQAEANATLNQCMNNVVIKGEYSNDKSTEGYNVEARVKNFGYYNWKFDMNCFYAVSGTNPPKTTDTPKPKPVKEACKPSTDKACKPGCEECVSVYNITLRNVDPVELFPTYKGKDGTTSDKREPGFNWTKEASVPEDKNTNYAINPEKLKDKMQNNYKPFDANGDKDELDYEFNLSSENLREIKKYNKNAKKRNYTNYQGQYTKESGVYAYLMPKEIFNYSTNKTTRSPGVNNRVGIRNNRNPDKSLAGGK